MLWAKYICSPIDCCAFRYASIANPHTHFGVFHTGLVSVSFSGSRCLFFLGLFPDHFLSISDSNFRRVGLPNHCFRIENIAKFDFSRKSFLVISGMHLYYFCGSLGNILQVSSALKTMLKTKRFLKWKQISSRVSRGASRGCIWGRARLKSWFLIAE